ncbi:MAG: pyridoxamine 5'-phosphate oxidase [Caldilineaceae bacterium]|nr:pyridoxamine 5'-phosphate oxidase [Caldilineaceae bacterium]
MTANPYAQQRSEYQRGQLNEADAPASPLPLFQSWLTAAVDAGVYEPNAMCLATADPMGRPSARTLLLKGCDADGFVFYTNYESRKGRELAENPWAAMTFWWGELQRQVRIEGRVERVDAAESDAYFASRPRGSQLGAHVSAQSSVIPNRAALEARLSELESTYAATDPPRPPYWGGYRLRPESIEFWQGGPHRLHDRLRFTRQPDGGWIIERLAP